MCPDHIRNKAIYIIGPTGVGKTQLAIDLAKQVDGEIISADSRYLYRGMDIGTAKPDSAELSIVKHHMIDIANPSETISLAQYVEQTTNIISEIIARNKLPILIGGTGQYFRALTQGWSIPVLEPDRRLRDVLAAWGFEIGSLELHAKLVIIDSAAAAFIQPANMRRTVRALEVIFSTGEKFSSLRKKENSDTDFWVIGLIREREELFRRVDDRIERMFQEGLVDEVKALKRNGYKASMPSMSAIGYQEVLRYLDGSHTLDMAKSVMKSKTRQFIRRQANWFKPSDPLIHWYNMGIDPLKQILIDLKNDFLENRENL